MKTNLLTAVIVFAAVSAFGVQPQQKSTVNKDARFYVEHYEENNTGTSHVTVDYDDGVYYVDDKTDELTLNWDDGGGGSQTWNWKETIDCTYVRSPQTSVLKTVNTWPATFYPNLVVGTFVDDPLGSSSDGPHQPVMVMQHCDLKPKQDYSFVAVADDPLGLYDGFFIEEGHLTGTKRAKIVLKFYAGGMGLPKQQSVYRGSVSAFGHQQTGVTGMYKSPVYDSTPIPSQKITLGELGQLDPDGIVYALIPDGSTKDITPKVDGVPYYTFSGPELNKYTLASQVNCPALGDTNLDRTSLGVAEVVNLGALPAETTWSTSAGKLSARKGTGTVLTAPYTAGSATVTATIRKVSLSIDFEVAEPSGINSSIRLRDAYSINQVAVGMEMNVFLEPTNVSFSQIEMQEPGEPTATTGYFNSHAPPTHADSGANKWHGVDCDNLIDDGHFDSAYDQVGWPIGVSGTYTWPIHPIWRVVGDTNTHQLSGWTDQVTTLSSDGTMTIEKLGHSVVRHTYETYGIAK